MVQEAQFITCRISKEKTTPKNTIETAETKTKRKYKKN